MSLLISYGSGLVALILSWFLLKDFIYASIAVFFSSSILLYIYGPNAVVFSLCLSNGWIILNSIIEKLLPIND
ncbi:MAG: hypothetical protein QF610_03565 [Candidatus Thalassarchaeaceae archaeon]|nr:hypothetical protein [Candidatus Thalassarchaeaceae archaeon]|tara:strand:- start:39 stop:257 length:219 start_codon:yes stop_codon:yes gene_type:complete